MPIAQLKRVQAYPDSTGTLHTTIEEWQKAELVALYNRTAATLQELPPAYSPAINDMTASRMNQAILFASLLLTVRDEVLSILTTGPRSRPSTRKRAGTTNPRRATKQQAAAGFKAMREAVDHGGTNATRDADVPAEPVGAD